MSESGTRNINIIALRRADPFAKEIIDSASHVALYTFEESEWEKTNIEGALFVYSRHGSPWHSLVILNRLNRKNLIEPITKGIEWQLKEPFLLFRNTKLRIYGIWFYDRDECVRLAMQLSSLVSEPLQQASGENMAVNTVFNAAASTSAPVNICRMLSKAQDDFNANQSNQSVTAGASESTPSRAPDMASKSVIDFFAKAGSGASVQIPNASSLPSPGIFPPRTVDANQGPFLLQRLMSNPVHSVEHIEKQQRSVTPQDMPVSNGNISLDALKQNSGFNMKSTPIEKNSKSLQKVELKDGLESNGSLEKEINLMHLSSPKPVSPLATFFNQSQDNGPSASSFNGSKLDERGSFSLSHLLTPQQKPALMPPTMFTASSTREDAQLEPLTKNQLIQAFNYLLKHDAEFVNKLHEAYVKSFSEKLYSVS